jgi:hypothetical protein
MSSIGNPILTLYDYVIDPVTDKLGIGTYNSPYRRFGVVTGVTALGLWFFKPPGVFDKEGNARPWTLTSETSGSTPLPWYVLSLTAGALSVLFI